MNPYLECGDLEERDVCPPDAVEGDGRLPPLVLVLFQPGLVEGRLSHLKANVFHDRLREITKKTFRSMCKLQQTTPALIKYVGIEHIKII